MKIGLGQLICLIAGITFLSFGTGLLSGRIGSQKQEIVPVPAPQPSTVSTPHMQDMMDRDEGVPDVLPPPPVEETPVKKSENTRPAVKPISAPAIKEPTAPALPLMEKSLAPVQLGPAQMKEANRPIEATGRKFVVQVLSTPSRPDASAARNKMMTAGFPAGVFEADLGEKGMWYRIYVGPYDSESEAEAVVESVREISGFASSFVKPLD